jgi:imidazolonepropionase-like amidohydrolase
MAADIIAVEGNPLDDLTALQRPRFVMARGRVVQR